MFKLPPDILEDAPELDRWCILHAYRGSIAHGMYVPSDDPDSIDDIDTMAIVVPPLDYYFGMNSYGSRDTKEIKRREWDIVVYTLGKFVFLLSQGNPNVLSLLWTEYDDIIGINGAGALLRANRNLFVGKHVHKSFCGYANSQLKRMTAGAHKGYMGAKRKELVARYGYDTKNAAHLIRLLRMGIEFLETGNLMVRRPDAEELLAIKKGEWSLEQVQGEAEQLFGLVHKAHDNSTLPDAPDVEEINNLLVQLTAGELAVRQNAEREKNE